MFRIGIMLIIASFLISGCSTVDVYTFKKERVDQSIQGNEGYVQGPKLETVQEDLNRKRTLIGVDIDMSGLGSSEEKTSVTSQVKEKEDQTKAATVETKTKAQPVVVEKVVVEETEEDWIK